MPQRHATDKGREGFTLVEMAIVLVVIGLLVGGILVGRDLIKAAEIRAQISQVEKYKTAVKIFKLKYDSLPGDMHSDLAVAFGMTVRSGAVGHGNGNGMFEDCTGDYTGDTTRYVFGCEPALFWSDLSAANLIDGSFTAATDAVTSPTDAQVPLYFPAAKLGGNNSIGVFFENVGTGSLYSNRNRNKLFISQISFSGGNYDLSPAISPMDAFNIDSKIDDGMASTGAVEGNHSTDYVGFGYDNIVAIIKKCRTAAFMGPGLTYQTAASWKDEPVSCQLYFVLE